MNGTLIVVVVVIAFCLLSSSAAAFSAFVWWDDIETLLWKPKSPEPAPSQMPQAPPIIGGNTTPSTVGGNNNTTPSTVGGDKNSGTSKKPMIFLNMTGHGDAKNGRMQDAVDMANGKGWEFVSNNIDGFNLNDANTHEPSKIMARAKKTPIWMTCECEVSAVYQSQAEAYTFLYNKIIADSGLQTRPYGRIVLMDKDPFGRQLVPGVMAKWKHWQPYASITKTIFCLGRGGQFSSCSEAICEGDFSAIRESDGFVYEQVPGFLNADHGHMGVPDEWPGHRDEWKKMFELFKRFENKKIIWLMATRGKGSLKKAQESFNWMKSQNLLPDVIIVANYGNSPEEKAYHSIPEGSGNEFPDTTCGIARWLLMNR